jgi:hypothetical protein
MEALVRLVGKGMNLLPRRLPYAFILANHFPFIGIRTSHKYDPAKLAK